MRDMHACHQAICSRLRAEQFKQKVLACFRAWDDWAVYPDKLLIHWQNIFLGLVSEPEETKETPEQNEVNKLVWLDSVINGIKIIFLDKINVKVNAISVQCILLE